MKVRILQEKYRTRHGEDLCRGDVIEMPELIALKLIRFKTATEVEPEMIEPEVTEAEPKAPEAAVVAPHERAVKPKPRARKGG